MPLLSSVGALQFPIDTLQAAWVEVAVYAGSGRVGVAACMLVVGEQLAPRVLETESKGRFPIFQPETEFWYQPTGSAIAVSSSHTLEIESPTGKVTIENDEDWDQIIEAIERSDAMATAEGDVMPLFIGRPNEVPWSRWEDHLARLGDGQTFAAGSDPEFGLTVVQNNDQLVALHWSHNKGSAPHFMHADITGPLEPSSSHDAKAIFIGYHAP